MYCWLVCLQLANPPQIPELNTFGFLEHIDQPTAAQIVYISGGMLPDVKEIVSRYGPKVVASPMWGITTLNVLPLNDPKQFEFRTRLRQLGFVPMTALLRFEPNQPLTSVR